MSSPDLFGARLAEATASRGPLCVGIDPHPYLLSAWGLSDDAAGLREFALRTVDALSGAVAVVKPQAAFFERHGSAGIAVLEEVIAACKAGGLLSIVDAKRGDIGSTMAAYTDAYLRPNSPLAGDALTVSPYLGPATLAEAFKVAKESGRGLFVLALTSNPQGASIQHARNRDEVSVAATVCQTVAEFNRVENDSGNRLGSSGVVIGATVADAPARAGIDIGAIGGPILAPGLGAQGSKVSDIATVFADAISAVIPTSSRAILEAGPDSIAIAQAARELNGMLSDLRS